VKKRKNNKGGERIKKLKGKKLGEKRKNRRKRKRVNRHEKELEKPTGHDVVWKHKDYRPLDEKELKKLKLKKSLNDRVS
jgi:hypothetical protein